MELNLLMGVVPVFLILHALLRRWKIGWVHYAGMAVSALLLVELWVRTAIMCNECSKTELLCCEWMGFWLLAAVGLAVLDVLLLWLGGWLINRQYERRAKQLSAVEGV